MKGADTERSNRYALDALAFQRLLQRGRLAGRDEPPGEQQQNRARRESSQRERKRARRRRVEPLNIVDGEQDRLPLAQHLQHVAHRHADRPVIDRIAGRLLAEKRDLERTPPRRRDQRGDVRETRLEQVAQTDVSEPALGLRRSRHKDAEPPRARELDAREPKRRLADPSLALQHQRASPTPRPPDEGLNRGAVLLPADDPQRHDPRTILTRDAHQRNLARRARARAHTVTRPVRVPLGIVCNRHAVGLVARVRVGARKAGAFG
jgi:hypothetical protein